MSKNSMWAVQYHRYGGPEVLEVRHIPVPDINADQVLVEIAAFSLNAADLKTRQGKMKGVSGFGLPKGTGLDFSGTVAEVGNQAAALRLGDRVWGYMGLHPGRQAAAAQYLAVSLEKVSRAPEAVPLEEAAALPLVGLTGLQAMRRLRVGKGSRVLVIGGNGGVGSVAIQIARALGAEVDALAGSSRGAAEQAGADRIYDYRAVGAAQIADRYDAILDTAAHDLLGYRRLLKRGGRIATVSPAAIPAVVASVVTPGPIVRMISVKPDVEDLKWLAARVDEGALVPIIDASFKAEDIVEAHRVAETSSVSGKRIVVV